MRFNPRSIRSVPQVNIHDRKGLHVFYHSAVQTRYLTRAA